MAFTFEWDPQKAIKNAREHGVTFDEAAKAAVHPVPDAVRLRQIAAQGGLKPLRMAGVMKVAEGLTTLEEVLRSTPTWE